MIFAFGLGVLTHHTIFIRGEWHLYGSTIFNTYAAAFASSIYLQYLNTSRSLSEVFVATVWLAAAYFGGLFSSIAIYRAYFHPLRHFPGPRLVALTKLWHVWKCRNSQGHFVLHSWYQQYGTLIRTGPNEITILESNALELLDGPKSQTTRSDWYDILYPRTFSVFGRDRATHSGRRRVWDHAMNANSLMNYYKRIAKQVEVLESVIADYGSEPVPMNDLISWFSFDSMGDFGFGQSFEMMKTRKWVDAIVYMQASWALLGVFNPAIWIPRLTFDMAPFLAKDWFKALKFADDLLDTRIVKGAEQIDLAAALIGDYNLHSGEAMSRQMLYADAGVLFFAGSDTTGASLATLLYYLARFPKNASLIQDELHGIEITDVNALSTLRHLTGTINESMRLLPAALTTSPGSRITPPEGMRVNGTFIPGGVKVCTARYTLGRLPSAYEYPEAFIPERWYSRPELVKDRRAFAPFGIGRYGCVGKAIAMAQLRLTVACLLSKYNVAFAPGHSTGEAFELQMKDQATAHPGPLVLVFSKRSG